MRAAGLCAALLAAGSLGGCNQITGNTEEVSVRCANGSKDGSEADVDCGGDCGKTCDVGMACGADGDCTSGVCCNGMCARLSDDPANCGGCGHDCQGTACVGALCETMSVETSTSPIAHLTIDATNLYWYAGGSIWRRDLGELGLDGSTVELVGGGALEVRGLALSGSYLYWVSSDSLQRLDMTKQPPAMPTELLTGSFDTTSLAASGARVFWRACSARLVQATGDQDSTESINIGFGQLCPDDPATGDLTADGTDVYWVNASSQRLLIKRSLASGKTSTVAHVNPDAGASPAIVHLAIDGALAFYAVQDGSGYAIMRAPVEPGQNIGEREIARGNGVVRGLAARGDVYWTATDGEACEVRRATAGKPDIALARDDLASCGGIAVSDSKVYWVRVRDGGSEIATVAR